MNPKHISTSHDVNHENDYNYNFTAAPPPTPVSPNSSLVDGLPSFGNNTSNRTISAANVRSGASGARANCGAQPLAPLLMASLSTVNDAGAGSLLVTVGGGRTATGAQTPGSIGGSVSSAPPTGDIQQKSRFHIIKINTGPCRRGRWMCTDSDDGIEATVVAKNFGNNDHVSIAGGGGGSGASSGGRPSSYHNVPILVDEASMTQETSPAANNGNNNNGHHHHHHHQQQQQQQQQQQHHHHHHHHHHPYQQPQQTLSNENGGGGANDNVLPTTKFVAQTVTGGNVAVALTGPPVANPGTVLTVSAALSPSTNQQLQSLMGLHPPQNAGGQHQQHSGGAGLGVHPSSAFVPVISGSTGAGSSNFLNPGTLVSTPQPTLGSSGPDFFTYPHPQPGDVGLPGASVLFGKILPQQMANDAMGAGQANSSFDGSSAAASGTNANIVAIDNKIEQAMDLVKTHLLYAVREEVEVLKVRIVELEKKVGNLEKENKILREYAPPEILAQFSSSQSSQQVASHMTQTQTPQPQQQPTPVLLQQTQQNVAQSQQQHTPSLVQPSQLQQTLQSQPPQHQPPPPSAS